MGLRTAAVLAALVVPAGLAWATAVPTDRSSAAASSVGRADLELTAARAAPGAISAAPGPVDAAGGSGANSATPGPEAVTTLARESDPAPGQEAVTAVPRESDPAPGQEAVTARPRESAPAAADRWVWPVPGKPLLGRRFDPPDVRWGAGHRGVDLKAPVGGPVRAPADGTVTFVGRVAGRDVLVITSSGGLRSTLEPVLASVPVGAAVAAGSLVGALAATPGHCVPASCLHWGVLRGDSYLDPLSFLRAPVVLLPNE